MSEPILELGDNSEINEDSEGDTVIRNTETGTSIKLTSFIDVVGAGLGEDSNRISESFFEALDSTTLTTTDAETAELVYNDANEDPETIDPATGTVDIDLSVSNWWQPIQATEDITIEFSNVSTDPSGNSVILFFEDGDDLGPYDVTFPEGTRWPGGDADNTIPEGGNIRITLTTFDGGTTWDALRSGENFEEPA